MLSPPRRAKCCQRPISGLSRRVEIRWHPSSILRGDHTDSSYANYVQGLSQTAHDSVTILGVAGHVVTARIAALQTNGTVKLFQGYYTVTSGAISQFSVRQVS